MTQRQPLTLILFLLLILSAAQAQTTVRGSVQDTSSHTCVPNASVVFLRAKDSILQAYGTTAANGAFVITGIDTGQSIVLITYPGYADYTDHLRIEGPSLDLGILRLTNKVTVMKEVVVRGIIPAIRVKGDTTEYTADSFRTQPNATVEDLLEQLPGIQVDRNGKMKAQGETVKKVLVDGEEFFGDDPTTVTRNLRAAMVQKVQVYDKKSDQATFTGIDDGFRDKTVNLQLKKDSRKGSFGKIDLGGGSNGYYENQAMVNLFRGKERISAYSILGNTGRVGLTWQDNNAYAGENDQSATKDVDLDAWDGNYNGQGIPIARTGGLHYNNAWNNDNSSVNANYKISDLDISGSDNTVAQNNLPGNIFYTSGDQVFRNRVLKNKLQTTFTIKPDSGSLLKIDLSGLLTHKQTSSRFTSETKAADSAMLNQGIRGLTDEGQKNTFDGNALWEKNLGRKGRTISIAIAGNNTTNHVTGYLYSDNTFFAKNADSISLVDQFKANKGNVSLFDGKAVYTQPLSPALSLSLDYEAIAGRSRSAIRSYNKSADSSYDNLDTLYSNDYHTTRVTQKGGAGLSLSGGKWRGYAGNEIGFTRLRQDNVNKQPPFARSFTNWYPHASLTYLFSLQNELGMSYEGNVIQPLVDQLQPVLNNYDPLNIFAGNPRLDPVFTNLLTIHYNHYRPMTRQYLFSNFNYLFSGNQITTNTSTDSAGLNTYQYVNKGGYSKYWGYLGLGGLVFREAGNWGFNLSAGGSRSENLTNGLTNILTSSNTGLEGYLSMGAKNKYTLELKAGATYYSNRSSLQQQAPENYWVYLISPDIDLYFPARFKFHSDVNYTIRQRTAAFTSDLNVFLWSAWVGKYLLKKDALLFKLAANDLLDQNKGVTRSIANNFITQNTYSTVRQFFLFSVVWSFSGK